MPFDEFFSSKNKRHYVQSELYAKHVEPEVQRILALPEHERLKIIAALNVKASKMQMTVTEKNVRRRLIFLWLRKHTALRRIRNIKIKDSMRKKGAGFYGGYNTT